MIYQVKLSRSRRRLNAFYRLFKSKRRSGTAKLNEKGAALVTTLLVLMLLLGFVAIALSRTSSDNLAATNDAADAHSFGASEAGLEDATRDFATVLEQKLNPTAADITNIQSSDVPGFSDTFDFTKTLKIIGASKQVILPSGDFQGLYSLRDEWQVDVMAKEKSTDAESHLMRRFYNNRIPLFQFGAFYNDDLELNRPPLFTFGGRVHTNGNLFITANAGNGIYFKSKMTAAGEVINDIWKTNTTLAGGTDDQSSVFIPNSTGTMTELATGSGSVKCSSGTGATVLVDPQAAGFPYPKCAKNPSWATYVQRFEGNLQANTPKLTLPVDRLGIDLIEMVRRSENPKDKANIGGTVTDVTAANQDSAILSKERFANKPGIRITLSDSRDKLPQCDGVPAGTRCGTQLDQAMGSSLGYTPVAMNDLTYKTTPLNANRMVSSGRDLWIKVELVDFDADNGVPVTTDVTDDFLSLGVTDEIGRRDPANGYALSNSDFIIPAFTSTTPQDSRSIIKLQHFYIDNNTTTASAITNPTSTTYVTSVKPSGSSYYYSFPALQSISYSTPSKSGVSGPTVAAELLNCTGLLGSTIVSTISVLGSNYLQCIPTNKDKFAKPIYTSATTSFNTDESAHYQTALINSTYYRVVPFPIEMYDAREGNRYDANNGLSNGYLYQNGVMSLIDIDVFNLKRFFRGDFDALMPKTTPYAIANGNKGLKSTDVPESRGWVVYVSDRRGDNNFDGRYDMEQVDPTNGTTLAQDLNKDGKVGTPSNDTNAAQEGPNPIDAGVEMGLSAVTDHQFYRRGVRLINARDLPGAYDSVTPANTKGFTFASENGIYVRGNYNVQSVALPGGSAVADSSTYSPAASVPAAIVGDSVTVLSNSWSDGNSFNFPFDQTKRIATATQVRFAMISGDSQTYRPTNAQGAGSFTGLNGGIHNFKRFLEIWTNVRLNYAGSLINLYNAYNNNGRWKCCNTVYNPPIRDWTFDSTFTDPDRLPPGSPYVYYLTFTGFQRVNQ